MESKTPTKKAVAAKVAPGLIDAIEAWAADERVRTRENVSLSQAIVTLVARSLGTDENGAPLAKEQPAKKRKAAAK